MPYAYPALQSSVFGRHTDAGINIFYHFKRIGIALFGIAQDDSPSGKTFVYGSFRAAVFGTPHWVCRHETSPTRVLGDHFAELLFGRSHVDHHLPFVDPIQHLDGQQRNRIDRRSQNNQIGLCNRFVERHDPIDQAEFHGSNPVLFGVVHSDHLRTDPFILQHQGERPPMRPTPTIATS